MTDFTHIKPTISKRIAIPAINTKKCIKYFSTSPFTSDISTMVSFCDGFVNSLARRSAAAKATMTIINILIRIPIISTVLLKKSVYTMDTVFLTRNESSMRCTIYMSMGQGVVCVFITGNTSVTS